MLRNRPDAASFVRELMARGRYTFTFEEAKSALKVSNIALRAALRRLKTKGFIAMPLRGFFVIVPPEYTTLSCLPADQFIEDLMLYLKEPYYIGLLSAAELHGAAHQKPQEFQVITSRNRKMIVCGRITIRFMARKTIGKVPTVNITTQRGFIKVSTPEATVFDLLLYPEHAGGLSNIATVLSELSEKIEPSKLKAAKEYVSNISVMQRAGYIFDRILKAKKIAGTLELLVRKNGNAIVPLVPSGSRKGVPIDHKWNLFINEKVEPDV